MDSSLRFRYIIRYYAINVKKDILKSHYIIELMQECQGVQRN